MFLIIEHPIFLSLFTLSLLLLGYGVYSYIRAKKGHVEHTLFAGLSLAALKEPDVFNDNLKRIKELNEQLSIKEYALMQAHAKFNLLIENAPVMILGFDNDGFLDLWNKECEIVFGYTKKELMLIKDPLSLFYDIGASIKHPVWEDLQSTPGQFKEFSFKTKSGTRVNVVWATQILPDGTTIVVGHQTDKFSVLLSKTGELPTLPRVRKDKKRAKTTG